MPETVKKLHRLSKSTLLSNLCTAGRKIDSCEACGLNDSLDVHHIVPFAILEERPQIMPQIGLKTPDDIDNLIVLCKNHHGIATKQKFHESILSKKVKSIHLREMILQMFIKYHME